LPKGCVFACFKISFGTCKRKKRDAFEIDTASHAASLSRSLSVSLSIYTYLSLRLWLWLWLLCGTVCVRKQQMRAFEKDKDGKPVWSPPLSNEEVRHSWCVCDSVFVCALCVLLAV
jgi:hypothetical protein